MQSPNYNKNRLSEQFHGAWESRQEERNGYSDEILQIAEFQAKTILNGVTDLISPISTRRAGKLHKQMLGTLKLEDDSISEKEKDIAGVLFEMIDDSLGKLTIKAQAIAENRIDHLVAFLQDFSVSVHTMKYLHRITKCYLFGFDEQCIIMCRSALESCFMQDVTDSQILDYLRRHNKEDKYKKPYHLGLRIHVAKQEKDYGKNFYREVEYVVKLANEIIHPDRYGYISLTDETVMKVLMETIATISVMEEGDNNGKER